MTYTDDQIKKMFPDLIAEIIPKTDTRRGRIIGGPQFEEVSRIEGIEIKIPMQKGVNALTGEPIYDIPVYSVGPFDANTSIRTDRIPKLSKEQTPLRIIRAFLEHDGHKDDEGNIRNFSVEPVDPKLIELEREALSNPDVKKDLKEFEAKQRAAKKKGDARGPKHDRLTYRADARVSGVPEEATGDWR